MVTKNDRECHSPLQRHQSSSRHDCVFFLSKSGRAIFESSASVESKFILFTFAFFDYYTIIFLKMFSDSLVSFLFFSPLILQWANTSPAAGYGSDVCSKFGCATKHQQRAIQFRVDVAKKSKEDVPYATS